MLIAPHVCASGPSAQIRDVDLDTLEKVTSIIAYGDIEAEDTRHLTELNFIKVGGTESVIRSIRVVLKPEYLTWLLDLGHHQKCSD